VHEDFEDQDKYKYTSKVDIWAMGCIFYEVLFLTKAFPIDFAVLEYRNGQLLSYPSSSETICDAEKFHSISTKIRAMLEVKPSLRPKARNVKTRLCMPPQHRTLAQRRLRAAQMKNDAALVSLGILILHNLGAKNDFGGIVLLILFAFWITLLKDPQFGYESSVADEITLAERMVESLILLIKRCFRSFSPVLAAMFLMTELGYLTISLRDPIGIWMFSRLLLVSLLSMALLELYLQLAGVVVTDVLLSLLQSALVIEIIYIVDVIRSRDDVMGLLGFAFYVVLFQLGLSIAIRICSLKRG